MLYLLHIRVDKEKKQSFRITAKDEAEAKAKLLTRLPPDKRENYILDAIEIDPRSLDSEEPYGVFLHE